jgi:hypothetical protein
LDAAECSELDQKVFAASNTGDWLTLSEKESIAQSFSPN